MIHGIPIVDGYGQPVPLKLPKFSVRKRDAGAETCHNFAKLNYTMIPITSRTHGVHINPDSRPVISVIGLPAAS